jgi:hypothetical protein
MADEQKLDATFFAFRKREQRHVLTRAAIGYFLIYAVIVAIYLALTWQSFASLLAWYGGVMQTMTQGGEPGMPPSQVMSIVPYAFGVGLVSLILFAAFEAACLRWLVRGESGGGVLGLTAGADTWRVFATYFVWLGLFIAFSIAIVCFYVLTNAIASIGGAAQLLAMVLGALAPLGFFALLIWGAVRFAPAAATSVARKRFAFLAAPRVTKGHFWPLLGSFVILWIGYAVIVIIVGSIIQLPAQSVMTPVMRDIVTGNEGDVGPALVRAMTSPIYLVSMGVYTVFSTIASVVLYIAMFGVNARAVLAAEEAGGA